MMKENKKGAILLKDFDQSAVSHHDEAKKISMERLKKPLILALMGIVFAGCMYLIFKPSKQSSQIISAGLNESVPQASDKEMQADKEKAYEQETLNQKEQQKKNAILSLADYWKEESTPQESQSRPSDDENLQRSGKMHENANPSINSYRNAQSTLGSFYRQDDTETAELRKQLKELKEELAQKDVPSSVTVNDQLALMEKSYQMAAKYLPATSESKGTIKDDTSAISLPFKKHKTDFRSFTPAGIDIISSLQRRPSAVNQERAQPTNSVKAYVEQTQVIIGESTVRLRLVDPAEISGHMLPKGTVIAAMAKIQGTRLQLRVTSIEIGGNIIPADISAYDLDGQLGLLVPYSQERRALNDIAGNMSQQSGTSLTFSRSAGQQIVADLGRGVVQGISGYFSKKVKTAKVILKAGHQVLLISKK